MENAEELQRLRQELEQLSRRQDILKQDIQNLQKKLSVSEEAAHPLIQKPQAAPIPVKPEGHSKVEVQAEIEKGPTGIERFVGVNLISFLGIVVLLAGMGIGINYAIQHGLLAPVVRFVLGYLAGGVLMLAGYRLLKKFRNYGAILLNGGMAVFYFNSYAATGFYQFFPSSLSFIIMLLLTALTVYMALRLDIQYTALVGLVGAYGIPFLVGGNHENNWILLAYAAVVNCGILFIGFRKNWRVLNYSAFGMSWIIFLSWLGWYGSEASQHGTGLLFSSIYFLLFYFLLLAYKLIRDETFRAGEVIVLLLNSLVYYLAAVYIVHKMGDYDGYFTAANAALHGGVVLLVWKRKISDKAFFRFLIGIFLSFVTLTIPLQFHGKWITWLWAAESIALYAAGRKGKHVFYAWLSLFTMAFSILSLVVEWQRNYMIFPGQDLVLLRPILNPVFLSTLMVAISAAILNFLSKSEDIEVQRTFRGIWLIAFIGLMYFAFRNEISQYFLSRYTGVEYDSGYFNSSTDVAGSFLRAVVLFIYTCGFLLLLHLALDIKGRDVSVWITFSVIIFLIMLKFSTYGLHSLDKIRPVQLQQMDTTVSMSGRLAWILRYTSYAGAGFLIYLFQRGLLEVIRVNFLQKFLVLAVHLYILFLLSFELNLVVHEAGGVYHGIAVHKAGYSILWGAYALFLVFRGFMKDQSYLRIAGVALILFVVLKVFFFDLSGISTQMRILLLIIMGLLMLVIAFFYQKNGGVGKDKR